MFVHKMIYETNAHCLEHLFTFSLFLTVQYLLHIVNHCIFFTLTRDNFYVYLSCLLCISYVSVSCGCMKRSRTQFGDNYHVKCIKLTFSFFTLLSLSPDNLIRWLIFFLLLIGAHVAALMVPTQQYATHTKLYTQNTDIRGLFIFISKLQIKRTMRHFSMPVEKL